MELSRSTSPRLGYEWQAEFSDRQRSRASENQWFCGELGRVKPGDIPEKTEDLLAAFLRIKRDRESNLFQSIPIERMCSSADLSVLKAGENEHTSRPMSLLDERSVGCAQCCSENTCRRSFTEGPLTTHELYKALRKKRYSVPAVGTTARPNHFHSNEPDADRRLVYITDPDSWNLLAVIATASRSQGEYLRDFICRYIEFKTYVGAQVPAMGPKQFALEFHLPFYVCRTRPLLQDHRLKSNKPLRRTGKLNFVKFAPLPVTVEENDFDCIYEVQISVLVTGVDHWSWTAFAFVDTYYKRAPSESHPPDTVNNSEEDSPWNQESPEFYHQQFKDAEVNLDPLTGGEHVAEPPTWKPREYFLKVLRSRVRQVNHEWHNTVFRVLQKIEPQVEFKMFLLSLLLKRPEADVSSPKTHDDLLSDPHDRKDDTKDQVLNKRSQIFFDKSIRLLQQMSNLITLTLDAWARFREREAAYFSNLEKSSAPGRHPAPELWMVEINRDIEDLRALRQSLDHQREHLNALLQKLEKGLQLDNNEIAALQQRNATLITALTISASFLGLISTTAAIFSMQTGVPAGNIIATVLCLLIGLLMIFAQVFRSQLKIYMSSKGWNYGPIWNRHKSMKSPDVERDVELDSI